MNPQELLEKIQRIKGLDNLHKDSIADLNEWETRVKAIVDDSFFDFPQTKAMRQRMNEEIINIDSQLSNNQDLDDKGRNIMFANKNAFRSMLEYLSPEGQLQELKEIGYIVNKFYESHVKS